MRVRHWLTINERGSARLTKSKPSLRWDEISILLELNIPDALFDRPRLEAKIDIPKEAVGPDLININVIENVKEAIEQAVGLDFSINVVKNEVEDGEEKNGEEKEQKYG